MLVSVIIPTFNRAKTIERAVDSVLAQTWKPMEIIVVDDGSTDATVNVLAKYGDAVRLICQKNQGPGAARNTGIKAAKGEIISFLDSDDAWMPEKTERQVKLFQRTESAGVGCCVCNAKMVYATRTLSSFEVADLRPPCNEGIWTNPAEILIDRFLFFNQVAAVRREMLERTGYFRQDLRIMEDYDLALRLSLMGPWAFIADPLVIWHGDAESGLSRNLRQLEICLKTLDILESLKRSPHLGPLLPAGLLHRRLRYLRRSISAMRFKADSNAAIGLWGRGMLMLLKWRLKVYWRLPTTPRMITQAV